MGDQYDDQFYDVINEGSRKSAAIVVPIVLDILGPQTKTMIDVGCGQGVWTRAFRDAGCEVLGIDGAYVDPTKLFIDQDEFIPVDLANQRATTPRPRDLAISLEVAEHLPESRADSFVDDLCSMADVVLFSAAIPGQGGTGHVNEQWPKYWADKFLDRGYLGTGALRWLLWDLAPERVENWYAQNLLLFATAEAVMARPAMEDWFLGTKAAIFPVVHPVLWNARRP